MNHINKQLCRHRIDSDSIASGLVSTLSSVGGRRTIADSRSARLKEGILWIIFQAQHIKNLLVDLKDILLLWRINCDRVMT